jgi:hypothetical protein
MYLYTLFDSGSTYKHPDRAVQMKEGQNCTQNAQTLPGGITDEHARTCFSKETVHSRTHTAGIEKEKTAWKPTQGNVGEKNGKCQPRWTK